MVNGALMLFHKCSLFSPDFLEGSKIDIKIHKFPDYWSSQCKSLTFSVIRFLYNSNGNQGEHGESVAKIPNHKSCILKDKIRNSHYKVHMSIYNQGQNSYTEDLICEMGT